jgi:hypothetical protein
MDVKKDGFKLLSHRDLERYRNKFPNEYDLQDEWEDAVTNLGKYVNLLVGQQTNEDQRAEMDEENYYVNSCVSVADMLTNVGRTCWQHSLKSAFFFTDKVVSGNPIPDTLSYVCVGISTDEVI